MVSAKIPATLLSMTMKANSIVRFDDPILGPQLNQPNSCKRILVVEDEQDLRQLTAEVLIDAGYQVDVAGDGATAWSALQLAQYDLLITDQFLPKLSGVELLRKIHAAHVTMPIIMATAFLPTWGFALHTWLQPVNMLLKPYSFQKLLTLVKNVLHTSVNAVVALPLPMLSPEATLPPPSRLTA
jgi:DNA-binding response OmpR family regulator